MKLYTRRGDGGKTDLFGGQRVTKDSPRVEACGAVDELNSAIGLAAAVCGHEELQAILRDVQARLFELGADLATPHLDDRREDEFAITRIGAEQTVQFERWIDQTCEALPGMQHFILPGGGEAAARLHVARAICRRAERACVSLQQHEPGDDAIVIYLNRLSDLLFAMARRANQLDGVEDVPWAGRGGHEPRP